MTRGDNYDHGMERSAAKGERERERKGASDGEQGVSPMKWSNIDFTQPVAIESRTIRLSLSVSRIRPTNDKTSRCNHIPPSFESFSVTFDFST